jgi:hypothetical protein
MSEEHYAFSWLKILRKECGQVCQDAPHFNKNTCDIALNFFYGYLLEKWKNAFLKR